MKIQVRYFASVREKLGAGETLSLDGADAPRTVGQLHGWLARQSATHAAALDDTRGLRMALNQTLCDADEPLHDGAEVAFFPPVTGG
ncbi:MAG: molybdopterin converting factor subunit 1 [Aquabacterium sp.]|nr:molybdopterin converting factor subunit 1 [Aquabacterium sp.]